MSWLKWFGVPKEGGNINRLIQIRKEMFLKHWTETSLTSDKVYKGPITLFDFSRPHDAADAKIVSESRMARKGWKVSDDGTLGGFSKGRLQLHDTDTSFESLSSSPSSSPSSSTFPPFVRWSGTISTKLPPNKEFQPQVHRSGFCYMRLPEFPMGGINLKSRYNALEMKCRSDGRLYTVNLKASTFLPDDLYQGFINIPSSFSSSSSSLSSSSLSSTTDNIDNIDNTDNTVKSNKEYDLQKNKLSEEFGLPKESIDNDDTESLSPLSSTSTSTSTATTETTKEENDGEFVTLVLPFRDFIVTAGGRPRERQRPLDGKIIIEHIGFMLADGIDGDFQFDIARIRAVNYMDGEIIDDDNDDNDDNDDGNDNLDNTNNEEKGAKDEKTA